MLAHIRTSAPTAHNCRESHHPFDVPARWLAVAAESSDGRGTPITYDASVAVGEKEGLRAPSRSDAQGLVESVHVSPAHTMVKSAVDRIDLLEGLGVAGDAHRGATVQHRSRVRQDAGQPNLRQVHLIHGELHDELFARGFAVAPGQMGENIVTRSLDLLAFPKHTMLLLGDEAAVLLTGLRNPCSQLDGIRAGLMSAVLDRDRAGNLIRKSGVMGIVIQAGTIRAGDVVRVYFPPAPHWRLEAV